MKQTQKMWLSLAALLVAVSVSGTVFADVNATAIVDEFNSLNGGAGWKFNWQSGSVVKLTTTGSNQNVDTSAYVSTTGGTNWFETFCVEPTGPTTTAMIGKLNYAGGATKNSNGVALNLGAAYLYKMYATGTLSGFNYSGTSTDGTLATAIRILLGFNTLSNWTTNTFLNVLMQENTDKAYWQGAYDPSKVYNEIGDYSVFIMQVTYASNGTNGQDFLYLAKHEPSTDVPEPASILLWSLGGLGIAGSWARKRRMKRLALG